MRSGLALAAIAAVSHAQKRLVKINGVFHRYTEWKEFVLAESETLKWTLNVASSFNEDTGDEKIVFHHYLDAPVMSTDKVTFEVGFTTKGRAAPTDGNLIMIDVARCQMEINSQDKRYWTSTLSDAWMKKTDYDAGTAVDKEPTTELAEGNNWTNPWTDTEDNESLYGGRWCTPAYNEVFYTEYQCKALSCFMQRNMQTGDSTNDI